MEELMKKILIVALIVALAAKANPSPPAGASTNC